MNSQSDRQSLAGNALRASLALIALAVMVLTFSALHPSTAGAVPKKPDSGEKAPGEPGCWTSGIIGQNEHCQNRNLYRVLYWGTARGDREALKAAVTATIYAYAVRGTVEDAVNAVLDSKRMSRARYQCIRDITLDFPEQLNRSKSTLSGTSLYLSFFEKVPWKYLYRGAPVGSIISALTSVGQSLAKAASKVGLQTYARAQAVAVYTCL